jgi:ABC-type antimicrobial peptide transport system permease subunit
MGLLSLVYIDTRSALGVLLDGGYLHFVPTPGDIVFAVVLIIMITMITAWFPARRASRLSAAAALRHYE